MPNTNLENSKTNMKSRIRNRVGVSTTPRDLGRLAKSARFVGLVDDAEVETDLDTQMAAAIPSASIDELVEIADGINELRDRRPALGGMTSTDQMVEGSRKFLNANSVQPAISVSGDLSYDNGVVSYTTPTSAALQVVATVGDLPAGASAGDQAVVQSNNKLYIKTAEGWYAVALINTAPTVSGNNATYELATDGTPTVITLTATDPENDPVTFSHSVTNGALNGTTVEQNDNVFTITPHASNPATFELTFSANDSVNVATTTPSSFSLAFGVDWSSPTHSGTVTSTSTESNSQAFGYSMASDDNYIVVGAYGHYQGGYSSRGRVYVYDHSGTLLYEIDNPMPMGSTGRGNANDIRFAWDVAVGGGKIAVAARFLDNGGHSGDGAVFTFNASDGSWGHGKIAGFNNPNDNRYAQCVEVTSDGNYFIIGHTNQTNDVPVAGGSGMVSIHDTTTVPVSAIHCPNGHTQFGSSLALSDDNNTLFIGQGAYDAYRGIIWEYDITDKTSPSYTRSYDPTSIAGVTSTAYGQFAYYPGSIKVKGSTLIGGGFSYEEGGVGQVGIAVVWDTSTGNLVTRLVPPTPYEYGERFGWSVGISNDQQFFFVGATQKSQGANGEPRKGVVYVYDRSGTLVNTIENPTPSQYLPNEWNPAWGGSFGSSIEVTDTTVAIGAHEDNNGVNGSGGKVYFFAE